MEVGLFLILSVILAAHVCFSQTGCPSNNRQEALSFRPDLAGLDLERMGKYIPLLCCATGYTSLLWSKFDKKTNAWIPWPPPPVNYLSPKLTSENQTLEIPSTTKADNTTFLCKASKGSEVISHTIRLYIYECMDTTMGPILTYPFPGNKTIQEFGGSATFPCTGYFGCYEHGEPTIERQALWYVMDKGPPEDVSPRYHTKKVNKSDNSIITNTLTISNISTEDLGMTFICLLDSPNPAPSPRLYISISKSDPGDIILYPWLKWVLIGAGCLAFVVIVTMTVKYFKGPQIKLWVRSHVHVPQLAPKTISEDEFSYNVFLCHANEDNAVADKIRSKLSDYSYSVFMSADISGSEWRLSAYQRVCKKSAVIMMLFSENLKEDRFYDIFLQSLIDYRDGRDIIILEMTKFVAKDAVGRTKNLADNENDLDQHPETNRDVSISIDAGDSVDGVGANEDDVFEPEENRIETVDIKFWNCLKRFKVPDEKSPAWKKDKFYCCLRNRIPQFKNLRDRKISRGSRNSSSTKPLMFDEAVTPNGIDNPQGPELSPVDECKFQFNDKAINKADILHHEGTDGNARGACNSEGYDSFQAGCQRHEEITEESLEAAPENVIVTVDVYQEKNKDNIEGFGEVRGENAESEEGMFSMSGETSEKELERYDGNTSGDKGSSADILAEGDGLVAKSDTVELSPMRTNKNNKSKEQFTFEQTGDCDNKTRLPDDKSKHLKIVTSNGRDLDQNKSNFSPESGYESSELRLPSQTFDARNGQ